MRHTKHPPSITYWPPVTGDRPMSSHFLYFPNFPLAIKGNHLSTYQAMICIDQSARLPTKNSKREAPPLSALRLPALAAPALRCPLSALPLALTLWPVSDRATRPTEGLLPRTTASFAKALPALPTFPRGNSMRNATITNAASPCAARPTKTSHPKNQKREALACCPGVDLALPRLLP